MLQVNTVNVHSQERNAYALTINSVNKHKQLVLTTSILEQLFNFTPIQFAF